MPCAKQNGAIICFEKRMRLEGNIDPECTLVSLIRLVGWLVGCFGLNGPLRQYFSLYRAVSQREGENQEK